jgi:predicted nucleotidyltransferase
MRGTDSAMATVEPERLEDLPALVAAVVGDFVDAARAAFGDALRSVVLFGSAAEGRLRSTSDVNLILVLAAFAADAADRLREPLRVGRAAARLNVMFLLEDEVEAAGRAFAAKFADVKKRRRVLFGRDPFASLTIPRTAEIARLKQVLLNLVLRLRGFYVERGLREEQLARVAADAAGPLRVAAATILELEGRPAASPKAALETLAADLGDGSMRDAVASLSAAREIGLLAPGTAGSTVLALVELASRLRSRVEALG